MTIRPAKRKYNPLAPPKEVENLTFSILFTPEMVHYIPMKVHQPEGLKEIRAICPNCTNKMDYPMKMEQNPDRMETIGYADLPTIILKEYQFTAEVIDMDYRKHGMVWTGRCHRCSHISFVSKWNAETAIDHIMAGSLGA